MVRARWVVHLGRHFGMTPAPLLFEPLGSSQAEWTPLAPITYGGRERAFVASIDVFGHIGFYAVFEPARRRGRRMGRVGRTVPERADGEWTLRTPRQGRTDNRDCIPCGNGNDMNSKHNKMKSADCLAVSCHGFCGRAEPAVAEKGVERPECCQKIRGRLDLDNCHFQKQPQYY